MGTRKREPIKLKQVEVGQLFHFVHGGVKSVCTFKRTAKGVTNLLNSKRESFSRHPEYLEQLVSVRPPEVARKPAILSWTWQKMHAHQFAKRSTITELARRVGHKLRVVTTVNHSHGYRVFLATNTAGCYVNSPTLCRHEKDGTVSYEKIKDE